MAKSTVIYRIDDFDGSDADETVYFALDGKTYEIDLTKKNATALRNALKPYIGAGRRAAGRAGGAGRRGSAVTLYSALSETEKARFRKWAKLPHARRIADARVEAWTKAGKP